MVIRKKFKKFAKKIIKYIQNKDKNLKTFFEYENILLL